MNRRALIPEQVSTPEAAADKVAQEHVDTLNRNVKAGIGDADSTEVQQRKLRELAEREAANG